MEIDVQQPLAGACLPQTEGSPLAVVEDVGHFMDHEVRKQMASTRYSGVTSIAGSILAHAHRRRIVATPGLAQGCASTC